MSELRPRPQLIDIRYRVVRFEGAGNFAEVWRGVDERFDMDVAVKVLAAHWALDPDIRERFIDEARLLREIVDDAVVRVHDIGETDDGRPYFVMDLASGGTLEDRLSVVAQSGAAVPAHEVRRVIEFLDRAMRSVHRRGLVHRDIKPSNILVRGESTGVGVLIHPGESLVLGDFGMARHADATALTRAGGTPGYRSPEQREAHGSPDHRADIYAAAAVIASLYEPDQRGAERVFADGHLLAGVDLPASMPLGVRVQLTRSLDSDPDARPARSALWAENLAAGLMDPVAKEESTSRRLVFGAVSLAVLALVGGSLLAFGRSDGDEVSADRSSVTSQVSVPEAGDTAAVDAVESTVAPEDARLEVIGNRTLGIFEQTWFWIESPSSEDVGYWFDGQWFRSRDLWIHPTAATSGTLDARLSEEAAADPFEYSVISRQSLDYACSLLSTEEMSSALAMSGLSQTRPPTVFRNQCKWDDGSDFVIDLFWHRDQSALARVRWFESQDVTESVEESVRVLQLDTRTIVIGESAAIEVDAALADPELRTDIALLALARTPDDAERPGAGAGSPDEVTLGCSFLSAAEVSEVTGVEHVRAAQAATNSCNYVPRFGEEGGLNVTVGTGGKAAMTEARGVFGEMFSDTEELDLADEAVLFVGPVSSLLVRSGDTVLTITGFGNEREVLIELGRIGIVRA